MKREDIEKYLNQNITAIVKVKKCDCKDEFKRITGGVNDIHGQGRCIVISNETGPKYIRCEEIVDIRGNN